MSQVLPKDFIAVITACGMVTPVGHTTKESCAALRAGISRIGESPEFRVPDIKGHLVPASCAWVSGISDGHRRFLRHYRMALRAFTETIHQAKFTASDFKDSRIYLCISEPERIEIDSRIQDQLVSRICKTLELPNLSSRTQFFSIGHAGVYYALQAAMADLAAGNIKYAIVGGVDSYLDEATLEWLADINRLKTDGTINGIIPGEGAAFIVIEDQKTAVERKISCLAHLDGIATAMEHNGIYADTPCRGEGLTNALQQTLESLPDQGVNTSIIVCDLNGERYRALEWGLAIGRALGDVGRSPAIWHPAGSIGDAGAAAGPINLAFGTIAVKKGYAKPEKILVWGSSDDGQRGSAYLQSIETI